MMIAQDNLCALCKQPERMRHPKGGVKRLHVDHDHTTGAVRSLLCSACNSGLGMFKDDMELLQLAVKYLKLHRATAIQQEI